MSDGKTTFDVKDIFKIFAFFRRYIWFILLSIPFSMIMSSSRGGLALIAKEAIDKGIVEKNIDVLLNTAFFIVGFFFLVDVSRIISVFLLQYATQSVIKEIRENIFWRIQMIPLDKQKHSSSAVARVISDTEVVSSLPDIFKSLFRDPFAFIFLAGVLIYMNLKLAIFSILAFSLILIPSRYISRKVAKASWRTRESADKISEKITESIQGARVVRIYSLGQFAGKFSEFLRNFKKYSIKSGVLAESSSAISEFAGSLVASAVIIYAGHDLISGKMTPGEFFSFFGAVIGMWEPIKNLSRAIPNLAKVMPSISRILEFDKIPSIKSGKIKKETFESSIEFQDVSVVLGGKKVLSGVNFVIRKGERVALVGRSGAGKTTLVSLIPRFFDPTSGRVLIDGVDIKELDIASLRSLISFVEQEPFIFDDTVFANVSFAKPSASREEVEKALELAGFDLSSLPLDFICGENGKNLSVGQKHRIAIARAILKNSPIVIMDEPTASLDPKVEESLLNAFRNLMQGKTVILISHRRKITEWVDRFVLVENKKVVEIGVEGAEAFFNAQI